ncbi:MAG: hypothetical protein WC058_10130 [Phycisphaeraceae bacterium]
MGPKLAIDRLLEAQARLDQIIKRIEVDNSMESLDGEYHAVVLELYWLINRVWNTRHMTDKQYARESQSQQHFEELCKCPRDLDL